MNCASTGIRPAGVPGVVMGLPLLRLSGTRNEPPKDKMDELPGPARRAKMPVPPDERQNRQPFQAFTRSPSP